MKKGLKKIGNMAEVRNERGKWGEEEKRGRVEVKCEAKREQRGS